MFSRIFLTTLALFISYNLWLHFRSDQAGNKVYSYWVKENYAKAQHYLLDDNSSPIVLCGSSLSSVMSPWLKDSIYDFSTVGGSWLTGLEVIYRSHKSPRVIGIEINFLMRTEDTYITRDVLESNWIPIRKIFPSFYAFNQPMDVLTTDWQKFLMRKRIFKPNAQNLIFNSVFPVKEKEYSEIADSTLAVEMVDYIGLISSELEKRGCKTFLYLMPMDTALLNSPRINNFLERVSKLNLPLITPNRSFKWKTVDSEHLTSDHALLYANVLSKEIKQIQENW